MWYAAGDKSADFSWYTRRATLAAIYGTTLAFWLRDPSPDLAKTLEFLDRRLADHARLHRSIPRRAA
jgi:ubiquinone biosynthesis protein COQ9